MRALGFAGMACAAALLSACGANAPAQKPSMAVSVRAPLDPARAAAAEAASREQMVRDGRAIAEAQCSRCHGLDQADSPRPDAPPFREIGRRYRFPVLSEELMEGVKLGHPDMPRFEFAPLGVDALIAYLQSLQRADRDHGPAGAAPPR